MFFCDFFKNVQKFLIYHFSKFEIPNLVVGCEYSKELQILPPNMTVRFRYSICKASDSVSSVHSSYA